MKMMRQSKIIELVQSHQIETQEELAALLKEAGFDVTQATVSRDIRDLKLSKITGADGKQQYTVFTGSTTDGESGDKLLRVFRDAVVSMDYANNLIVLKTLDGMAMAVAACIDATTAAEALGTIAGDDTVFCVVRSEDKALEVISKFKGIQGKR